MPMFRVFSECLSELRILTCKKNLLASVLFCSLDTLKLLNTQSGISSG